jgi:GNAT superfamily N-acetyltransferase
VTDYSTFAWLCDVFVLPTSRGKGLGKWLVQTVVNYPDLQDVKRILLGTRDAHGLYRHCGFKDSELGRCMELLMNR